MHLWVALSSLLASASAPEMVLVPAGPFLRGDDHGEPDERPARRILLSAFAIDRTEVTVSAYERCVAASRCRRVEHRGTSPLLPMTGVTWQDAAAYCAYAGKRLPTEAEWEKAARGEHGLRYPWGDDFDCSRGNFGSFEGEGRCAESGAPGRPVEVGRSPRGASPYGALDMAGNVWEWVADAYAARYYEYAGSRDPKNPPHGRTGSRVLRGGGCCSIFGLPRSTDRLALPADYHDVDIGFRCAR